MGSITGSKWPETNNFLLKLVSLFMFWDMKAIPCEKLPPNWRSRTVLWTTSYTEKCKLALTRIGGVGGPCAQLSKRTSTSECLVGERRLTSPQLAASINSARQTPVSTSTVKRRLRDAGLLSRVAKKKPYLCPVSVLFPILIFFLYWPAWDMAFSLQWISLWACWSYYTLDGVP